MDKIYINKNKSEWNIWLEDEKLQRRFLAGKTKSRKEAKELAIAIECEEVDVEE